MTQLIVQGRVNRQISRLITGSTPPPPLMTQKVHYQSTPLPLQETATSNPSQSYLGAIIAPFTNLFYGNQRHLL